MPLIYKKNLLAKDPLAGARRMANHHRTTTLPISPARPRGTYPGEGSTSKLKMAYGTLEKNVRPKAKSRSKGYGGMSSGTIINGTTPNTMPRLSHTYIMTGGGD